MKRATGWRIRGFTLLELLFVLTIVALLAGIVAPTLTGSIARARESTLKEDLYVLRKAVDDYYADTGKYPRELDILIQRRYLRAIPVDPITQRRDTWILVRADDDRGGGIIDVLSGSDLTGDNGTPYKNW